MQAQASFQGTRWSVVIAARDKAAPGGDKALSELCRIYWYPLYAYVRASGHGHHQAEDMTQGFFLHLLGKDGLSRVDPGKGKFRSFLLVSMKHYLANEWERASAAKRGGGLAPLSIDMALGESKYQWEPAAPATPEVLYERSWALTVLDGVLKDLKGEYENKGKAETFDALERFVSCTEPEKSYAQVAAELKTSEGNVKVLVYRLRRRFAEILREHVADTVESDREIDEEIRCLMACFAS
jgi:RNA polymerase sigma-70 factor (ECF subfamily)